MKSRGIKKQSSKLINCILRAPIVVLRKARDFYVENLIGGCAGGGRGGAHRHLSPENHRGSGGDGDDNDLTELLRAAFGELDVNMNMMKKGVDRSYSDRVGRIGRIDENEPCDFMEDETNFLFPRCNSYAAVIRNLAL